jgi:hypothetical protein
MDFLELLLEASRAELGAVLTAWWGNLAQAPGSRLLGIFVIVGKRYRPA